MKLPYRLNALFFAQPDPFYISFMLFLRKKKMKILSRSVKNCIFPIYINTKKNGDPIFSNSAAANSFPKVEVDIWHSASIPSFPRGGMCLEKLFRSILTESVCVGGLKRVYLENSSDLPLRRARALQSVQSVSSSPLEWVCYWSRWVGGILYSLDHFVGYRFRFVHRF